MPWVCLQFVIGVYPDHTHLHFIFTVGPEICFISVLYLDLYVLGDDQLGAFHANQTSMCLDQHLN